MVSVILMYYLKFTINHETQSSNGLGEGNKADHNLKRAPASSREDLLNQKKNSGLEKLNPAIWNLESVLTTYYQGFCGVDFGRAVQELCFNDFLCP